MPLTKDQIIQSYPIPVYNYRVEIGGLTLGFSQVSGLSIGVETHTYKESQVAEDKPGPVVMQMPAQRKAITITLKKGVVGANNIEHFFAWIDSIQINQVEKKDIFIRLCNEAGDAVVSWEIFNVFPTKLDAPTFDANSNDVAIESLELMADRVRVSGAA